MNLFGFNGAQVANEMAESLMNGKGLKQFVEDDKLWAQFVDDRFSKLDKNHNGKLTHTDLEPAISGVGKALGMPPMGTDPGTDHIYTEVPFDLHLQISNPNDRENP